MSPVATAGDVVYIKAWNDSIEYYIVVKVYAGIHVYSGIPVYADIHSTPPMAYDVANGIDGYLYAVPARHVVRIIGADDVKSCNVSEEMI